MTKYDGLLPGTVLADASVAEFISELGLGIARAQQALDENTVNQLAEYIVPLDGLDGRTLLDLGLSPAFYHYQHADISLSMQLSLKVEKNTGVDLKLAGSSNSGETSSSTSNSSSSSSSSGSSVRVERTASIEIGAESAGSLVVGDVSHDLIVDSPKARINALKASVASRNPDVIPWVSTEPTPNVSLTTTPLPLDSPDLDKIVINGNTVAYVFGGYNAALVKVEDDSATSYVLNSANTVTIAAGLGSATAHANKLATDIEALAGYSATAITSTGGVLRRSFFPTGEHDEFADADEYDALRVVAKLAERAGLGLTVEGFADRQKFSSNNSERNKDLGNARSTHVEKLLRANGFTGAIDNKASGGDAAAIAKGDGDGQANDKFRKVDTTITGGGIFVLIEREGTAPAIKESATPANTVPGNRFVALLDPLETHTGRQNSLLDIDASSETFGLAARVGGGGNLLDATALVHAEQLAARINATSTGYTANQNGNVVTIFPKTAKFSLMLVSLSSSKIELSGTNAIDVKSEFKKSSTSNLTAVRNGNRTVAVSGSLDVGFSRKFEVSMSGNSSISARLVSLPAPPAFLSVMKDYLED